MAQFDVHRLGDGALVCDLQTDLLPIPETRVIAPLRSVNSFVAIRGLSPIVEFNDERWVVRIPEIAAVPIGLLSRPLGSLAAHRDEIKRAIDILVDGF